MEISLLTAKCTLVPSNFFDESGCRASLADVVRLEADDVVKYVEIPQCTGTSISENNVSGEEGPLPELFFILRDLGRCTEYNKILCSWLEGRLFLAIAQGRTLLLANTYEAADFTTAEYYIFLAMKSLQLNPEVSTICWRKSVGAEEELSLYRYFKAVEVL